MLALTFQILRLRANPCGRERSLNEAAPANPMPVLIESVNMAISESTQDSSTAKYSCWTLRGLVSSKQQGLFQK